MLSALKPVKKGGSFIPTHPQFIRIGHPLRRTVSFRYANHPHPLRKNPPTYPQALRPHDDSHNYSFINDFYIGLSENTQRNPQVLFPHGFPQRYPQAWGKNDSCFSRRPSGLTCRNLAPRLTTIICQWRRLARLPCFRRPPACGRNHLPRPASGTCHRRRFPQAHRRQCAP